MTAALNCANAHGPWICPKCGSVYGPGVKECEYCNFDRGQFSSRLILEVK